MLGRRVGWSPAKVSGALLAGTPRVPPIGENGVVARLVEPYVVRLDVAV